MPDQEAIDAVYPRGGFPAGRALSLIGIAKRAAVWDACNGRCHYCDVALHPFKTFAVEHVIPRFRGGTHALGNLVGARLTCNHAKSDK